MDVLDLAVPVEGSIVAPGLAAPVALRGRGTITHTWMDASEPEQILRRIDFTSLDAGPAVYLRDVMSIGGERTRWMVIERDGHVLFESSQVIVELENRPGGPTRGYPVPSLARVRGSGVSGSIRLGKILLEHDPLQDLPQPFRFLLSFAMRPRRVWTDSSFSLRLDAAPGRAALEVTGDGIASLTYLNPLSASTPGS